MTYNYKKEYKELYNPKEALSIVDVASATYIAIKGMGDPNEKEGNYSKAVEMLYAIAYTIKMSKKGSKSIPDYFDFVVPPLEGLWWQEGVKGIDYSKKQNFQWFSMIRVPDFVNEDVLAWAKQEVLRKKGIDASKVMLKMYEEGLCVQGVHIGSYDDEPETVIAMSDYLLEKGYTLNITDDRMHHEIYISDPRKTEVKSLKTIIRHPIRE